MASCASLQVSKTLSSLSVNLLNFMTTILPLLLLPERGFDKSGVDKSRCPALIWPCTAVAHCSCTIFEASSGPIMAGGSVHSKCSSLTSHSCVWHCVVFDFD